MIFPVFLSVGYSTWCFPGAEALWIADILPVSIQYFNGLLPVLAPDPKQSFYLKNSRAPDRTENIISPSCHSNIVYGLQENTTSYKLSFWPMLAPISLLLFILCCFDCAFLEKSCNIKVDITVLDSDWSINCHIQLVVSQNSAESLKQQGIRSCHVFYYVKRPVHIRSS